MNQPKALFLADVMHNDPCSKAHHDAAAFELRRLHAENEALLKALREIESATVEGGTINNMARAVIARAEGDTNGQT